MLFWLGTHAPGWLSVLDAPLMVSRRRLARHQTLPVARRSWVLDSGGFTELTLHGRWTLSPVDYVAFVRRCIGEVGLLEWAAPQDWMCEPSMLQRTGLTVAQHQERTVHNFLNLRSLAAELPIIPVVQGWEPDDYLRCVELYGRSGVDLAAEPVVGVGSVCRRGSKQHAAVENAIRRLAGVCGPLHGFGVSVEGLGRYGDALASSDSLAWSAWARRDGHLRFCDRRVSSRGVEYSPANCPGCAVGYANWIQEGGSRPTLFSSATTAAG